MATDAEYVDKEVNIFELVREAQEGLGYTTGLVPVSSDYDVKTRCPVHFDNDPSAKVYVGTNSVYCWVCGRTWGPAALQAVSAGVPYPVAVRQLLRRLGARREAPAGAAELRHLIGQLSPPEPETKQLSDPAPWINELWLWAVSRSPKHPVADVLEEAAGGYLLNFSSEGLVDHVRGVLEYCSRCDPGFPRCSLLEDSVLSLYGLAP